MHNVVRIYCEGTEKSFDFQILNKVVEELFSIRITPIGGKGGGGAVMNFAEAQEKGVSKPSFSLFFRDRDFDQPVPAKEELVINKRTHYSYRTTIENYLFDESLFCEFIGKDKKLQAKYPNIKTAQDVKEVFIQTAQSIRYYQAVRHTLGKMRLPVDFGTTWTGGSGTLPKDLSEEVCRQEALLRIASEKDKTSFWTEELFENILGEFLAKFDDAFFENLDFLVYFQGKDFATALQKNLPEFPTANYYKFALRHFDYTKFADLVQLRKIIADAL